MLRISIVLFLIFALLYAVYFCLDFTFPIVVLIVLFIATGSLIITIGQLVMAIKNQEFIQEKLLTIAILLIPLIGLAILMKPSPNDKIILLAYSDGVISGADITFYENNKMSYCSKGLISQQCFRGKYMLKQDTFLVTYTGHLPRLTSRKMVAINDKLVFLNEENEVECEFYLNGFGGE